MAMTTNTTDAGNSLNENATTTAVEEDDLIALFPN